jgi:hypothetical protein
MNRVIAFVAFGLALPGCTTPGLDLSSQATFAEVTVQFESEPPGAEAKIAAGPSCETPCAFSVAPDQEFSVTFALAGYQPQTVPVKLGRPEGASASQAAALLPNPVFVELKTAPARPARRPAAPATRAPAKPATAKPSAPAGSPWPGN